jgi:acyltransferase
MSKRMDYIDVAKGIGILLVVIGHLRDTQLCNLAKTIIFSFHMPLFFMIAGFNFNFNKYTNSFTAFVKHKFVRLLIPYFIINIFLIAYIPDNYTNLTVLQKYYTVLYGVGSKFWTWELTALWFLLSLFCAEIIFYFLIKSTNKLIEIQILILLLLSIIGYEATSLYHKGFILPWSIDISLVALLFMYVGWKFRHYDLLSKFNAYTVSKKLSIFILIILCFLSIIYFNGWSDMNARRFNSIFEFYIGGVAGSIVFSYISILMLKQIQLKNLFVLLGENSLYILVLHLFSARIFYGDLFQAFPKFSAIMENNPSICSALYVLWAIVFSLFFAYLIKYVKKIASHAFIKLKSYNVIGDKGA